MNDYRFGNFLYELRIAKGLSQAQLGEMLGVSNKAVSKWESGAAYPKTANLHRLAELLDTTVEELLAGERKATVKESSKDTADSAPLQDCTPTPMPHERLMRQWTRTRKLAKCFNGLTIAVLLQIPFVSGFLISVLRVNDTVGGIYVGITLLLFLGFLITAIVFRISASMQRKTLSLILSVDPKDLLPKAPTFNDKTSDKSAPVRSEPTISPTPTPRNTDAHRHVLLLEIQQLRMILWGTLIAAVPVFLIILLEIFVFLADYIGEMNVFLLFWLGNVHLPILILWIPSLLLYTILSVLRDRKSYRRIKSEYPNAFDERKEEIKSTTTVQIRRLQAVYVSLCSVMLLFNIIRLFSTLESIAFFAYAIEFFIFLGGLIAVLLLLSHRRKKELKQSTVIPDNVSSL